MKKTKNFLALAAAFVVLALCLFACSRYDGSDNKPIINKTEQSLTLGYTSFNIACCPVPIGYHGDTFHVSMPITYNHNNNVKSAMWVSILDSLGNIVSSKIETVILTDLGLSIAQFEGLLNPGLTQPTGDHADCLNACWNTYKGCLSRAQDKGDRKLCNGGLRICRKGCRRDYIESIIEAITD